MTNRIMGLWLAAGLLVVTMPACGQQVRLRNAGFDQQTGGRPTGWYAYAWGDREADYTVAAAPGLGRGGTGALRVVNSGAAEPGAYTRLSVGAGGYEMSVWARALGAGRATVQLYLFGRSPSFEVGAAWTQLTFRTTLREPNRNAEIGVRVLGPQAGEVLFDDVAIVMTAAGATTATTSTRVDGAKPQLLMFAPINVNHLTDSAAQWAANGVDGFMFRRLMDSWDIDVWSVDGDPTTTGSDDRMLQEVAAANRASREVGITSNFMKVALYRPLPAWDDDAAWARVTANFHEAARFIRLSGLVGMALDTEYISAAYTPARGTPQAEIDRNVALARERWRTIMADMYTVYPDLILLTMPEGAVLYGPYWAAMFEGMVQAAADRQARGGVHLLLERTYSMTNAGSLGRSMGEVQRAVERILGPGLMAYWDQYCSLAPGAWPLGYYRPIMRGGERVGWSGREETFGDEIVGSYADKSSRYSAGDFARQMAAMDSLASRYVWIYSHGAAFWQLPAEQAKRYERYQKSNMNDDLPTDPNLDQYLAVMRQR